MDVNHTSSFGTGAFTKPDLHSGVLCKVIDINPLILKNASGAPRSPVNNCGKLTGVDIPVLTPTSSEHAAAVLNLFDDGVIAWDDPEVVTALKGGLKHGAS